MATKKIVFVYPFDKVQKMFPNLDPSITMDGDVCGIERGWHPYMKSFCGYAYETDSFDSSCYYIYGFWFDKRFTKEILPNELYKAGYRLVEKHFKPMDKMGETDKDGIRYVLVHKVPENSKQPINILSRIVKQKAGDCHIQDRKRL